MINDKTIYRAISKLKQRSEKEEDLAKTNSKYLDPGILDQLENQNNQVIYGRRGTGKTHSLQALHYRLNNDKSAVVVFIDTRMLGSSKQFMDYEVPLPERCFSLFCDIIKEIHETLQDSIVENPTGNAEMALDTNDKLLEATLSPKRTLIKKEVKAHKDHKSSSGHVLKATLSSKPSIEAEFGTTNGNQDSISVSTSYGVNQSQKVIFPDIIALLNSSLNHSKKYLYLLLDEWSSIPRDIQPYLAEFLKRAFLPCNRVTLKIASIEYRSRFRKQEGQSSIGLELGSELSTTCHLDDYYMPHRSSYRLDDAYADVLLKHINAELPPDYLRRNYQVYDRESFVKRLFEEGAIEELSRSAGGVIRDLINVFTIAYYAVARPRFKEDWGKISRRIIHSAAAEWYERDKAPNLLGDMTKRLEELVNYCLGTKRARYFLVPGAYEHADSLQNVLDARVISEERRNIFEEDKPGSTYIAYALDYGIFTRVFLKSQLPTVAPSRRRDAYSAASFDQITDKLDFVLPKELLDEFCCGFSS